MWKCLEEEPSFSGWERWNDNICWPPLLWMEESGVSLRPLKQGEGSWSLAQVWSRRLCCRWGLPHSHHSSGLKTVGVNRPINMMIRICFTPPHIFFLRWSVWRVTHIHFYSQLLCSKGKWQEMGNPRTLQKTERRKLRGGSISDSARSQQLEACVTWGLW